MENNKQIEILADVLNRLVKHLQKRTDVQNIDLMNLSGFCRNCLSKWYVEAANERDININYYQAKEIIYWMPYQDWKLKYQTEKTKEELKKLKR